MADIFTTAKRSEIMLRKSRSREWCSVHRVVAAVLESNVVMAAGVNVPWGDFHLAAADKD